MLLLLLLLLFYYRSSCSVFRCLPERRAHIPAHTVNILNVRWQLCFYRSRILYAKLRMANKIYALQLIIHDRAGRFDHIAKNAVCFVIAFFLFRKST